MAKEKKYYWLKLKKLFFNQLCQKKMSKQEHGKDMQIAYLKMMLMSIDQGGTIYYQGIFDTLEEEIAEELNEPLEIIQKTIDFIVKNRMATLDDKEGNIFIPEVKQITGSESESAGRVRKHREKKKMLQCNEDVTECNKNVTTETETEKETETEIDTETETETGLSAPDSDSVSVKYTLEEIRECVADNKVNLSDKGIIAFYDQIKADQWTMYGRPITNLPRALREYAKKHTRDGETQPKKNAFHNFEQRNYDYDEIERRLTQGGANG